MDSTHLYLMRRRQNGQLATLPNAKPFSRGVHMFGITAVEDNMKRNMLSRASIASKASKASIVSRAYKGSEDHRSQRSHQAPWNPWSFPQPMLWCSEKLSP